MRKAGKMDGRRAGGRRSPEMSGTLWKTSLPRQAELGTRIGNGVLEWCVGGRNGGEDDFNHERHETRELAQIFV